MDIFWFLSTYFMVIGNTASYEGELLATIVIFREGERAPLKAFSQDPWKEEWDSVGYGQLTRLGKIHMYHFGSWLRQRYVDHLPSVYTKNSILVRSTDHDEAITSAYMVLAGMYPPEGTNQYHAANWQLIPVHTENLCNDFHLLAPECKQFSYLETTPPPMEPLEEWLQEKLNVRLNPNVKLLDVYDTISSAESANLNYKPLWSDQEILADIENKLFQKLIVNSSSPDLARLRLGPLFCEFTDYLNRFLPGGRRNEDAPKFKALFFAVNLETMVNVINGLKTINLLDLPDHIPRYGAAMLIELRDGWRGRKYINIFYKNSTRTLTPINIKGCGKDCYYDIFLDKIKPLINEYEKAVGRGEEEPLTEEPLSEGLFLRRFYGLVSPFGL